MIGIDVGQVTPPFPSVAWFTEAEEVASLGKDAVQAVSFRAGGVSNRIDSQDRPVGRRRRGGAPVPNRAHIPRWRRRAPSPAGERARVHTAFGDSPNLAWKLALVLRGAADEAQLDTYDSERRPVGARVAEWALNGFRVRGPIDAAIGIEPGRRDATRAAFEALFAQTPGGATRRTILDEVMRIQRIGPQAHDMEIGYVYNAGAIAPGGTLAPDRDPMASVYQPNTRPGARLPHAWVERDGRRNLAARPAPVCIWSRAAWTK
jgi:hypothetical protein